MKPKIWNALAGKYRSALAGYVARGRETELQRGYELGRKALELGLGVLDFVRLHQEAIGRVAASPGASFEIPREAKAAEMFLMESLSPFEVAQRGFRDTCERLGRSNDTLEERNGELAAGNARLEREIVRRKNAQDALAESELKFRSVVESAQDGIVTIDSRGRLVWLNHGAEAIFGFRRSELLGKSVARLVPKALRPAATEALRALCESGGRTLLKRPFEARGLHRNGGEFPLELTLATWRTRRGVFFTGVVRDIRERKQAELALRQSREHYIKLFNEAREMEENLRRLSSKVIAAQEEERKHVSRELCEEIGQVLTAANVSVALMLRQAVPGTPLRAHAETAQDLVGRSMEMVNRFAREIRPSMLDHLGPYAALQNYVRSFAERTGIKIDLKGRVRGDRLDNLQGTVLYRVAQESLTNVFKHAQATHVKIRLRELARAVCMEIEDNGCAFSPAGSEGHAHDRLGLLGMQERVRQVDGRFAVESMPSRGTTVRVEIPFLSRQEPTAAGRDETTSN